MKVLVAGSVQSDGGYEEEKLCEMIHKELLRAGHQSDMFLLPYSRNILKLPDQILAYQLLQIYDCDLLLTVGYPACMLKFSNKISYLFQTEPMIFEYWDSPYGVLTSSQYSDIKSIVTKAEEEELKRTKKVVCCSQLLCDDLHKRYRINAEKMLYPAIDNEIKASATQVDNTGWVCETSLLPWQQIDKVFQIYEQIQNKDGNEMLDIHVPNSEGYYYEALLDMLKNNSLRNNIRVCQNPLDWDTLKRAKGIICADYKSRRISNSSIMALKEGKRIITTEDSGALAEYAEKKKAYANMDGEKLIEIKSTVETSIQTFVKRVVLS